MEGAVKSSLAQQGKTAQTVEKDVTADYVTAQDYSRASPPSDYGASMNEGKKRKFHFQNARISTPINVI